MSNNCELVEELRKLKKSSLEAVDSEKEFSDFKQYMHIHIIPASYQTSHRHLLPRPKSLHLYVHYPDAAL